MPRTVAFFSYTRRDDRVAGGLLSAIRGELESRVSTLLGEDVEIFQDTDDIKGGENWRSRLEKAIAEAAYLIPVITPSFFNSGPCRDELERFLGKAEAEGRDGLIVPIHFIECPMIRDEGSAAKDALVKVIEETQWLDFRDHDHKTEIDGDLRRAVIDLAKLLAAKIRDDRLREEREEEQRRLAEEQAKREREKQIAQALSRLEGARAAVSDALAQFATAKGELDAAAGVAQSAGATEAQIAETVGEAVPESLAAPSVVRPPEPEAPRYEPLSVFRDRLKDGSEGPEMVVIPDGTFMMGSPDGEEGRQNGEGPRHEVAIERPFALGRYPVTFEEFDRFCEATGREKPGDKGWGRDRRPVVNVSWTDATDYLLWLGEQAGFRYRLPSEAEWEYACRVGTDTPRWWGPDWDPDFANGATTVGKTTEVGFYPATPWGLYDTIGNVWEWCADDWAGDYSQPRKQQPLIHEPRGDRRVLRGGSWSDYPRYLRSANRDRVVPGFRSDYIGFRPARTLTP